MESELASFAVNEYFGSQNMNEVVDKKCIIAMEAKLNTH